ncbi:potassium channel family protein [Pseudomonas sp. NPDC089401]|uniref:potassium channel family protein n=1 Tax=Pseudomonas sp. NPDC089401 TaxID=3364462 RepID=UPI00380481BB
MQELSTKQKHLSYKLGATLIGSILLFSTIFWMVGKFEGHGVTKNNEAADAYELLYFSVVSITTLGYGDFTPVGLSRLFASLEAIFGILFMGYSISQILSLRQSALVEYSVNYSVHEAYNQCIEYIVDAKESIGDKRREIQNNIIPEKNLIYI